MVTVYIKHGCHEEGIHIYFQMQQNVLNLTHLFSLVILRNVFPLSSLLWGVETWPFNYKCIWNICVYCKFPCRHICQMWNIGMWVASFWCHGWKKCGFMEFHTCKLFAEWIEWWGLRNLMENTTRRGEA